jgi:integrase
MASQTATTSIFIDKYHPKADGKCAISVRITFERKKKYYPTPFSLSVTEFEKVMGAKPRDPFKAISLKLKEYEKKAFDIIEKELQSFTWKGFEKLYLSNRGAKETIKQAFSDYAQELRKADRIGTAVSYECAMNSIESFHPAAKFMDVTPDFLKKYEKWMLQKDKSVTTIGIYLRSLRALFNSSLAEGMITKDLYPFGKKKYELPTSNNVKKALTLKEIGQIYHYDTMPGTTTEMAKDYWVFMYLCNGINMKDMCLLKYENITGKVIEFQRAKTVRTKRKVELIRVPFTEDLKRIIDKHGSHSKNSNDYIFPVLTKGITAERERQLIQQATQLINTHIKTIAVDLKIDGVVTTYAARHSFATVLQRSGVSTEFISEALGHSNVKTTQNYLAGFEDDMKLETIKALTAFKKETITKNEHLKAV